MKDIIEWKFTRLVRDCLRVLGYHNNFTVAGIRYKADPCSVGQTRLGEKAAEGAIRMIKERGLRDLKILDIGCGVGVIGLTIFSRLQEEGSVKEMVFADINIFNLNSIERTLKINHLDHLLGNRIRIYLSDVLKHIPSNEKFDLIISNPPDFPIEDFHEIDLSGSTLGRYSVGWSFHKLFYQQCHNYLAERGEVWFIENVHAIKENDLLPLIQANPNLSVEIVPEKVNPHKLYWSVTRKIDHAFAH